MATTRIIPMHINKGKTIAQCLSSAVRYAAMRVNWAVMNREEKMEKDSLRTSYHDGVITRFNMMARYLRSQGKKASWRDQLGNEMR